MTNKEDKTGKRTVAKVSSSSSAGTKLATKNYKIKLDEIGSTVVNIIDKTKETSINNKGWSDGWVLRVDGPHEGHDYYHININPKISGHPDPHIPISSMCVNATKRTARVMKRVDKYLLPLAIVIDTARVGYNIYEDVNNGTSRNTVETVASVAGGWAGGAGGAVMGASIGTAIFPGIGTLIGGIIGGISGGVGGAIGAEAATSAIGDELEWDIEICKCQRCGKKYKRRKYRGQSERYCPNCDD